jgi:4-amino-4-deoxy-L-arabinose transferase-like glycosyltransferase
MALLIFAAALLPRLYALGTFLTIDEVKWAEGAAQFLLALPSGDLAQTYWHFFPGVTIAWGGALILGVLCLPMPDLAACAHAQVGDLAHSIGWLRLWPVLLTAFGVTGVYLLSRKLLDERAALLATLLLAVDPFFLAHSRILNGDAVTAILMFLSLLAFLVYWFRLAINERCHGQLYLLLSGLMAGLALLTKLPAPLIGLFIGGIGVVAAILAWPGQGWPAVWRWLGAFVIWGSVALFVFVAFWPALWVTPLDTLRQMYADTFEVGGAGAGHDTFYFGQILSNPGPWFYPYAVAFRLTPVTMVGLLIALVWLVSWFTFRTFRFTSKSDSTFKIAWVMLTFVFFIIIFANASPKKLDRYVLAVIPALVFLSALGWMKIMPGGTEEQGKKFRLALPLHIPPPSMVLLVGLASLQLIFAIFAMPYYLTYYNPLLGGARQAVTQVPVGWGEGLERAAHYLNGLPQAESLNVSSWYGDMFHPYFVGQQASFADDGRAQLAADYVVFYVNQIQRQKPFPGLVNYFRMKEPVFVLDVGPLGNLADKDGVHWVEVYQAPAAQSASGAPKIEGVAQLLAYQVIGDRLANGQETENAPELSNDEILVTLFMRIIGPLPAGATFKVAFVPAPLQDPEWGVWRSVQMKGEWVEGAVIEWPGILTLPTEMPPNDYWLAVSLQAMDGSTLAKFAISAKDPPLVVK